MPSAVANSAVLAAVLSCWLGSPALAGKSVQTGSNVMPVTARNLYKPVEFSELPGWSGDDLTAALTTFRASCQTLTTTPRRQASTILQAGGNLVAACKAALALPLKIQSSQARAFFEQHFIPQSVQSNASPGLLTAYYEPVVQGRRAPSAGFQVPLHRRPSDLINLVDEADRAAKPNALTHARKTVAGHAPFPTRQEIDQGALSGQSLELFYVADEVERFFLQVQGSGLIRLADGTQRRITYDGKNGHPYTSVGRHLIDTGVMGADQMSLQALGDWLRADPERGRRAIWQNKSYVFFRELPNATGPIGVLGVPLTPLRSLAIDPAFHALGLPIFVDAPALTHITGKPFQQLMIGQDVGSAIKGPHRGDIYAGSGPDAGKIAGVTKQPGRFFVLLPKSAGTVSQP